MVPRLSSIESWHHILNIRVLDAIQLVELRGDRLALYLRPDSVNISIESVIRECESMSTETPLRCVPPDIEVLFGVPPLLSTEDPRLYWEMLDRFAGFVEPRNVFEWLWVKDLVDLCWEIDRLRRFKKLLIDKELDDEGEKAAGPEIEADSIHLLSNLLPSYETIDKLLVANEVRRDRILRELELRRERIAPLLRKASDQMIEGRSQEITLVPK